jgi:hypothetical protein
VGEPARGDSTRSRIDGSASRGRAIVFFIARETLVVSPTRSIIPMSIANRHSGRLVNMPAGTPFLYRSGPPTRSRNRNFAQRTHVKACFLAPRLRLPRSASKPSKPFRVGGRSTPGHETGLPGAIDRYDFTPVIMKVNLVAGLDVDTRLDSRALLTDFACFHYEQATASGTEVADHGGKQLEAK